MGYNLQIIWQKQNEGDMAHFVPSRSARKVVFKFYANKRPKKEKLQMVCDKIAAIPISYPQIGPHWTNSSIIAELQI